MTTIEIAITHLENAETSILSFLQQLSDLPEDAPLDQGPDAGPMLAAVLRSVSRAAGALESIDPPDPWPLRPTGPPDPAGFS